LFKMLSPVTARFSTALMLESASSRVRVNRVGSPGQERVISVVQFVCLQDDGGWFGSVADLNASGEENKQRTRAIGLKYSSSCSYLHRFLIVLEKILP
jgi:hypothetical protein